MITSKFLIVIFLFFFIPIYTRALVGGSDIAITNGISMGDDIIVKAEQLRVRATPRGTIKGIQLKGAVGRVLNGPSKYGTDIRWYINYKSGTDGWSSDKFIKKIIPLNTESKSLTKDIISTNTLPISTTNIIPTVESIKGKTLSGPIIAKSKQVIEDLHITNPDGPCISVINVTEVTIKNSEIGPCGANTKTTRNEGVYIYNSTNINVQNNVIHDMSTAVSVVNSINPIIIDRNLIYNIRGPYWQGQMVQFINVRAGNSSSKITCNIKDGINQPSPISGPNFNEDHISMYNSLGVSTSSPIEIAYNRIRGNTYGAGESGSGIALGDSPAGGGGIGSAESGNYYVHDNNIVRTNNVGIGVIGGHDIRIENNKVENNGPNLASMTGEPYTIKKYDTASTCYNISYTGNRGLGRIWAYAHDGSPSSGLLDRGGCTFSDINNNFNDISLTPAIFDEVHASCLVP